MRLQLLDEEIGRTENKLGRSVTIQQGIGMKKKLFQQNIE